MDDNGKIMNVRAIENGTVIDHIPSESLFKIISILGLENETNQITFGTNLESKRMGSKAIIKISNRYCADEEVNRISIIAPMARVNTIKDYKVVDKRSVEVPSEIAGFVKCANPRCITNNERVATKFAVIKREIQGIALKCKYCEKITSRENIRINI